MSRKHRELTPPTAIVDSPRPAKKIQRREQSKSPAFVSLYVNDIQIQTSIFDLRLLLGEISDISVDSDSQLMLVNELAEVRMSPQLAKRLTMILVEQLRGYETNFGQIPLPKEE